MTDFQSEFRQRAAEAQRALAEARDTGDDYLVEVRLGEIESLARLGAEHQIQLDDLEASLIAHGWPTPPPGIRVPVELRAPDANC